MTCLHDIKDALTKAIPRSDSWGPCRGEAYGFFQSRVNRVVKRAVYAVTYQPEAAEFYNQYDLLILHHPIKPGPELRIPYCIFHTALDCCEGGLNDQWRDVLGVTEARHFDENLGWFGKIKPIGIKAFLRKIEDFIGAKPLGQINFTKKTIESVVICSGIGGMVHRQASETEADCYITGETTTIFEYMDFPCLVETGHTLSERCGVNLFRKLLPAVKIDLAPLKFDRYGREHLRGTMKMEDSL